MLTSGEDASVILGWMSIACWVIVYSPQIYENYSLQSGEGLSVPFVAIWLLGDLANLVGAAMAGLLPTVIVLAAYYTICDVALLVQVYYYRWKKHRHHHHHHHGEAAPTEASPLLNRDFEDSPPPKWKKFLFGRPVMYSLGIVFVISAGFVASYLNQHEGDAPTRDEEVIEWRSQSLGWFSAFMYLASRIPQIIKNANTKCAGLSLALFIFCLGGNITYVASILAASTSKRHLVANASWLAGSGLTVFLDLFVVGQFYYYRGEADELPDSDSDSDPST